MEEEHLEEVKEEARTQGGRGDMVQMELQTSPIKLKLGLPKKVGG